MLLWCPPTAAMVENSVDSSHRKSELITHFRLLQPAQTEMNIPSAFVSSLIRSLLLELSIILITFCCRGMWCIPAEAPKPGSLSTCHHRSQLIGGIEPAVRWMQLTTGSRRWKRVAQLQRLRELAPCFHTSISHSPQSSWLDRPQTNNNWMEWAFSCVAADA